MVLGEVEPRQRRAFREQVFQGLFKHGAHENLFLDPDRHGGQKAFQAARRESVVGLQQALEFQKRLVVKNHGRDLIQADGAFFQHIAHGLGRKIRIVLFAGKALFMGRGHDRAVLEQGCGAVVVIGGNARGYRVSRTWRNQKMV